MRLTSFSNPIDSWLVETSMDSSGLIEAVACFPDDFFAFTGHFPHQPVLPGASLLLAVRLVAANSIGKDLQPFYVHGVKFKRSIVPKQKIEIFIKISFENEIHKLSFKTLSGSELIASGYIHCRSEI